MRPKTLFANNPHKSERGQIAVLTAFVMVAMLGFAALVVDLGFSAETKRDAQNDSDAMALAAVRELAVRGLTTNERQTNATFESQAWAIKNEVASGEILSTTFGTTCSGTAVADTVTVRLHKDQSTFLAPVLNVDSVPLDVCSTARTGMARGGPNILPIGLLAYDPAVGGGICYYSDDAPPPAWDADDPLPSPLPPSPGVRADFYYNPYDGGGAVIVNSENVAPDGDDEKCVIKIPRPGAGDAWADGNTGPIRLDEISQVDPDNIDPSCDPPNTNSGANEYGSNIIGDSDCVYGPLDWIRSLPGAQTGQTCSRFADRETRPHASHLLTDVFTDRSTPPGVEPIYNNVDVNSPHFGIIPVVTSQGSGTTWVRIVKFVTVYIIGCDVTGGGNNALYTVSVIPVNATYLVEGAEIVDPGDPGYTSDWPAYTIKLTE